MSDWVELSRKALRGALEVRRRAGVAKEDPTCVYDLAERLGVEVRFVGGSSFGGMYAKGSQTVLVPALRPPGRQAFTCGHELGHWFFGHGTHIDEIKSMGRHFEGTPEERLANTFASYLLMPPWAVEKAFAVRNWYQADCTPLQAYTCAMQLGVGYGTLIQHLRWVLATIRPRHAEALLRTSPKQLRQEILGENIAPHLVIVDPAWSKAPVDIRVGDMAILPPDVVLEGSSVTTEGSHYLGLLVKGHVPGISRVETNDGAWATFVRVSRKEFVGRSIYRHLEDPDVNDAA